MMGTGEKSGLQCPKAKRLFSPYLDGAVTGDGDARAGAAFVGLRGLQPGVSGVAADAAVAGERGTSEGSGGLGIEVATGDFAGSGSGQSSARFEGLRVRMENALHAFMVPATAGFLSALIIFGIAMVYFVAPSTLRADNDVPLVMVNTAPSYSRALLA